MSVLYVDTTNEKTSGNGIEIPGHVIQVKSFTLPGQLPLQVCIAQHMWTQV